MGQNRRKADLLFDQIEEELASITKREAKITKKVRSQIIAMAKKKKVSIEDMIAEAKPALIGAAKQANLTMPSILK